MSTAARTAGARLREKYARVFKVPLEDVRAEEISHDEVEVRCPTRKDLPVWTTGEMKPSGLKKFIYVVKK